MIEDTGKMKLLDDLPAQAGEDKLHHEVYAGMIKDILISNQPGISIGLFGKWGLGKSTIVNLLHRILPEHYDIVVFNAWKARGDTIRRQLLLAVLKVICPPDKYKSIEKFAGLEVVQECIETAVRRQKRNKLAFRATCKALFADWSLALPLLVGVICLVLAALFAIVAYRNIPDYEFFLTIATAFFLPAFAFLLVYVINKVKERYSFLIGNVELVSESQRLKYPEQFKRVFLENLRDHLSESAKGRLLVVVDDLDRCDPQTVVQALAALRQLSDSQELAEFLGNDDKGCQFLVPCDEEQVVLALETDGYGDAENRRGYHDYHTELLRKFFDVVVRMNEILPDDMTDYAAALCQKAGLEEKECREIVSIAGARDPRQVKKLLNALRISHESINQRCGKLLPDKNEMPRLAETERLLVALRETVPNAYRMICVNPSYVELGIPDTNKDEEKLDEIRKANGIIARAGAVSRVTADNLIYGKLEPELRNLPGGGRLQKAFIDQEDAGFSEALSSLRPQDRGKVKDWLLKKAGSARSDAELRGVLKLFLKHTEKDENERQYMADCVGKALLPKASLGEVLAGFKYFDQLELVWPLLSSPAKDTAIKAFHVNFLKDTAKGNPELAFLLRHANQLEPLIKESLRTWMSEQIKGASNDDEFVKRLFDLIPNDESRKACYGFAPEVAVALAKKQKWIDDQDKETKEKPNKWPRSQLVALFIGGDSHAAWEAIMGIFDTQGQLASPCQLNQAPPGVRPAWRTVSELTKIIKSDQISKFFIYFQKWLNSQNDARDAKIVLEALAPILFSLTDSDIEKSGDYLAQLLWRGPTELWLFDYIGKEPKDRPKAEKWAILTQRIFSYLSQSMSSLPAINNTQSKILEKIAEYRWPVAEKSDKLLGSKIKQLPPNGNTQQVESWAEALAPLLGASRSQSAEAIRELLKNMRSINEALKTGMLVLWSELMAIEDAKIVAHLCVNLGDQIDAYQNALDSLMSIQGSSKIIELCIDLLTYDQNWLKSRSRLLKFIAKHLKTADKPSHGRFQDKIKLLVISDNDATVIEGLTFLKECDQIKGELMKEVKNLEKSNNTQIQNLAKLIETKIVIE